MSVTISDHRRYAEGKLAESIKAAEEKITKEKLLAQAFSEEATTGNEELDKLTRAVQELLNVTEAEAKQLAFMTAGSVQEEVLRLNQTKYFYVQGMVEAYKKVMQIPAQIVTEAKTNPLHSV